LRDLLPQGRAASDRGDEIRGFLDVGSLPDCAPFYLVFSSPAH